MHSTPHLNHSLAHLHRQARSPTPQQSEADVQDARGAAEHGGHAINEGSTEARQQQACELGGGAAGQVSV